MCSPRLQVRQGSSTALGSPKAAFTGSNRTAANLVFSAEPDWNPAHESQAMDRVHRIADDNTAQSDSRDRVRNASSGSTNTRPWGSIEGEIRQKSVSLKSWTAGLTRFTGRAKRKSFLDPSMALNSDTEARCTAIRDIAGRTGYWA